MRVSASIFAACAILALVAVGGSASGGTTSSLATPQVSRQDEVRLPDPTTLVFVLNPSRRSHALGLDHAMDIIRGLARPRLALVGIYEQIGSDDGAPFDREFISSKSPAPRSRPKLTPPPKCTGTKYQKKRCEKKYKNLHESELAAITEWEAAVAEAVESWRGRILKRLKKIQEAAVTEESTTGNWALREALLTTGRIFTHEDRPIRCGVLLGGLAVRHPPERLPSALLAGSTLVAAGWKGTEEVKRAWEEALRSAGARIVLLPQAVTELDLVDEVRKCLSRSPS